MCSRTLLLLVFVRHLKPRYTERDHLAWTVSEIATCCFPETNGGCMWKRVSCRQSSQKLLSVGLFVSSLRCVWIHGRVLQSINPFLLPPNIHACIHSSPTSLSHACPHIACQPTTLRWPILRQRSSWSSCTAASTKRCVLYMNMHRRNGDKAPPPLSRCPLFLQQVPAIANHYSPFTRTMVVRVFENAPYVPL